jgi:hypothetical protein
MAMAGLAFLGFAFLQNKLRLVVENDNLKKAKSSNAE